MANLVWYFLLFILAWTIPHYAYNIQPIQGTPFFLCHARSDSQRIYMNLSGVNQIVTRLFAAEKFCAVAIAWYIHCLLQCLETNLKNVSVPTGTAADTIPRNMAQSNYLFAIMYKLVATAEHSLWHPIFRNLS